MANHNSANLKSTKRMALAAATVAAVAALLTVGILNAPLTRAQSAAQLAFEVASVRPHVTVLATGDGGSRSAGFPGLSISGSRVTVTQTVSGLIMEAYDVRDNQISGGPDSIYRGSGGVGANFSDIAARAPGQRTPSGDEVRRMFQTLLADRFQLRLHRETKSLPVYALVTGKNGPKLKESSSDRTAGGGGGGGAGLRMRIARTGISTGI